MIQSSVGSHEEGISRGIVSTAWLAFTVVGANTGLKKNPVRLVKKKSEKIAKGANFTERQRGILKANFIQWFLPSERWPNKAFSHQNFVYNAKLFVPRTVEPSFKELEIETADKMEIVCARLLNFGTNITPKSFIVTYLNHPSNVAEQYIFSFILTFMELTFVGPVTGL